MNREFISGAAYVAACIKNIAGVTKRKLTHMELPEPTRDFAISQMDDMIYFADEALKAAKEDANAHNNERSRS